MTGSIQHIVVTALFFTAFTCLGAVNPTHLRCEYHVNPVGIDLRLPRFSWQLESDERDQQQKVYRILVVNSPERLGKNEGDFGDSGEVRSDESIQIVYKGKPLTSRQQCWWKVIVMDQDGNASDWSESAMWSMGLLEPKYWRAQCIGCDKIPEDPVSAEPVCNESDGPGEQLLRPRGSDFFAAKGPHDLSGGDTPPVTNSTTDSECFLQLIEAALREMAFERFVQ